MLPNHFLDIVLPFGEGTIAYFAREPEGVAIFFVHGFAGSATGTWASMHELLPREASAKGVDIVFYGYNSKSQAQGNADLLRQLITDFCEAPQNCGPSLQDQVFRSGALS